ncbi:MAG: hypothetical protein E6J78_05295 [Deltaproteobacteria bacterium]|nr:MAG: hypothetical protein E6J78_05295 [Deltaproteobacteria bacterium]
MFLGWIREAYQFWLLHRTPFELLGLLMAVLGSISAVFSIRGGRKLTRDLRAIFDHLTTKEIGAFPAYMTEVERLISEARETIFIATDFPGHGAWSDRGRFASYVKALENRKADRVRRGHPLGIQVLCLDAAARERAMLDRFPESRWKDYVRRGGFVKSRRLYEELENCHVSDLRPQFLEEMASRQTRALGSDLRFADRWEYHGLMPVYLWIIDSEKAIFAIPSFGGDQLTEYAFYTEEAGLVQALMSVWSRYLEVAGRVTDAPASATLVKAG